MAGSITVLNGSRAGTKYEIKGSPVRMGRHPDCEVVIEVNAVSRYHAQVCKKGNSYVIQDLESRNGTCVNGKRIEGETVLCNNDRLRICDILFLFKDGTDSEGDDGLAVEQDAEDEKATTVVTTADAKRSSDILVKVAPDAKLAAILEITESISQTLELDVLFPKILGSLFKIFPQVDRALIILKNASGNLVPRAAKHRRNDEEAIRYSRTIVRRAMDEKTAILSNDASSDKRFSMSESIVDFRIRSIMCAPLVAKDQTAMGVIQIDTQSQNQLFDETDLQILTAMASQAAIAIENAQMHSQVIQQEKLNRELAFAKAVQHAFLPKEMPKIPGYRFWAFYEAAGEVGGDFYDFIPLPNGTLAAVLGDVSGKGVPAALLMAKATSDIKVALLTHPDQAAAAMGQINNSVCSAGIEDKFITVIMGLLDGQNNKIVLVNAGHMSPIIRRASGEIDEPAGDEYSGLPIGIMEDGDYEAVTAELNPGDQLVVYSDGISEAMNAMNQEYTIERLRSKIRSVKLPPDKLGEFLIKDVRSHVSGYRQTDDITLVIIGREA